jgi:hypothetical protein
MDQGKHNHEDRCQAKQPETVDAFRRDEAIEVLANHQENETWDTTEERQLLRKVDVRLMPILWFT